MSPRRNRARRSPGGADSGDDSDDAGRRGTQRVEEWGDVDWVVRSLTGSSSAKNYRCPGCDQEIRPGTPHVVVWRAEPLMGTDADDRRHWHTACWAARDRRRRR
jgi:hypothetical protein